MRVNKKVADNVLAHFNTHRNVGFRVVTLLSSCVRYAVLKHRVGGPALLAEEVRESGKLPVIEALSALGWETLVPLNYDLGNVQVTEVVEGVKGDAVANVVVGRPTSLTRRRLLAIMSMMGAKKGYLITVDPRLGNVVAYVSVPREGEKADMLEYLRRRAQLIAHYIHTGTLPPPDKGSWCSSCPYQLACQALQLVVEGVVPGA